jgi:glycosyltransferase involved in cell wall biosynthesis
MKIKNLKLKIPALSVIMPAYNSEDYIQEAILSVVNQSFQDFELIIIDDASTDSTVRIIKKFQKRFPGKITLIQGKVNLNCGGDKCANEGLKVATGKYIARMDADDVADPFRFEKQINFLKDNPRVFLVGSNAYVINKNGRILGEKTEPLSTEEIYKAYFGFHPLIHPTCMFKRKLKDGRAFRYEIKHSANNDYYTFFKLICQGYKFVNLDEKLLKYRIHNSNATFVDMKTKFINSLKIRLAMVANYGYIPSPKDIFMLTAQSFVVLLLPERMLLKIYFLAKGIIKKEDLIPSFSLTPIKKLRLAFSQSY